uniref:inositol-1,3,4-trisphosphate 5/6-kinase n=1 Tax=Gopherus agassizii TaxID=38772 RepID=A0A452HD49_9SAUR
MCWGAWLWSHPQQLRGEGFGVKSSRFPLALVGRVRAQSGMKGRAKSSHSPLTPPLPPSVCKTRVAHGPSSHEMALIFNEEGLEEVSAPCLLQSFINHDAVLFKVFVVGSSHFVVRRPSLKNFPRGESARKSIFFNSCSVSKPESCSRLTELDEATLEPTPPSDNVVCRAVRGLRSALGLSLFGVDLIVEKQTGRCAVIDVNAFPGESLEEEAGLSRGRFPLTVSAGPYALLIAPPCLYGPAQITGPYKCSTEPPCLGQIRSVAHTVQYCTSLPVWTSSDHRSL